jgi:selenocysteine-specific elongation factor
MHILATAGHVDHGKSALVAALTGTHPDRLKEEQVREMTIDLGFAFFNTLEGNEIGIIDVPGHIDFIDNMLAGMGGIEGVLLIISADEGIMPQTREHLAILDLLEVTQGIVVLTKIDLAPDPEWLELLEGEIKTALDATSLQNSPILRVSAKTGLGIAELKTQIGQLVNNHLPIPSGGNPRLPIDRIFTIQGFGTVVTGTLLNGSLEIGDELEILPEKVKSRVRGLQVHNSKVQKSTAGNRTAINLVNVDKELIKRGSVATKPNTYISSSRIDTSIRLLPLEGFTLSHNDRLNFFSGTTHKVARVRVLGPSSLKGGETGYLQLELDEPICVNFGDHYILRNASPSITVGGGVILETNPRGRYKLADPDRINELELKRRGSLADLILAELSIPITLQTLEKKINRDKNEIKDLLRKQIAEGVVVDLGKKNERSDDNLVVSSAALPDLIHKIESVIKKLHSENALRKSFLLSEISLHLRMDEYCMERILDRMLKQGIVQMEGQGYCLVGSYIKLTPIQEKCKNKLWGIIDVNPFSPPTHFESIEILGKELLQGLIRNGDLVRISEDIVFRKREFDLMVAFVTAELGYGHTVTVTGVRDRFETSRKYALPFLEYLDKIKVTRRVGDERIKF